MALPAAGGINIKFEARPCLPLWRLAHEHICTHWHCPHVCIHLHHICRSAACLTRGTTSTSATNPVRLRSHMLHVFAHLHPFAHHLYTFATRLLTWLHIHICRTFAHTCTAFVTPTFKAGLRSYLLQ